MLLIHLYSNLIGTCEERNGKPFYPFSNKRKNKKDGYEIHHIIPRSMGGSDHQNNLIYLTPREHYTAHHILARLYGGSLASAFWYMSTIRNHDNKITCRQYATAKSLLNEVLQAVHVGRKHTPEALEKMRLTHLGQKAWNKGKPHRRNHLANLRAVHCVQVTCPHCDKTGGASAMKRWHFNNCKHRLTD